MDMQIFYFLFELSHCKKEKQTLLFSATMPEKMRRLAHDLLNNPVTVQLALSKPAANVKQSAYVLFDHQKDAVLVDILKKKNVESGIIFTSRKKTVNQIVRALRKSGLKCGKISSDLKQEEKHIKDATVEMFLKTLELISTFHPHLSAGQLLEVERKMAITKKLPFEKWVKKSFDKKAKALENEKRKFQRERFLRSWKEWLSLENTHQAILPIIVMLFISSFIGWSFGISKNSCNPYFEQNLDQGI